MILHLAGESLVTTSFPHPQAQECPAVEYFAEM
jgi:hypothetical protein